MAKNVFMSGRVKAEVVFNDRTDKYQVRLCPLPRTRAVNRREFPCEKVSVGLPRAGAQSRHGKRLAVDDPRAMMGAARAAISFASSRVQDFADWKGHGAVVRPPKRSKRRSVKRA